MTQNTIKNVTMISTDELGTVSGGLFPQFIGLPDLIAVDIWRPVHKDDDDKPKDGGATGGW